MNKDLFSGHAAGYAKYRPHYPRELIDYIVSFTSEQTRAWDAATGNGQAAIVLADHFKEIYATDISSEQLEHAEEKPNIHYSIGPAEETSFPSHHFDLVTMAQAYHWINASAFRKEVLRVARPGGVVAIWGYHLISSESQELNSLIRKFYSKTGPYWEKERKHVDESYNHIEFDFPPLPSSEFFIDVDWSLEQFAGYLQSWSAIRKMISLTSTDPVNELLPALKKFWQGNETLPFRFPIFLKMGRIP